VISLNNKKRVGSKRAAKLLKQSIGMLYKAQELMQLEDTDAFKAKKQSRFCENIERWVNDNQETLGKLLSYD